MRIRGSERNEVRNLNSRDRASSSVCVSVCALELVDEEVRLDVGERASVDHIAPVMAHLPPRRGVMRASVCIGAEV